VRRDEEVARGKIGNLQVMRADVKEIKSEGDFGAELEAKQDAAPGDTVTFWGTGVGPAGLLAVQMLKALGAKPLHLLHVNLPARASTSIDPGSCEWCLVHDNSIPRWSLGALRRFWRVPK